MPIAAIFQLPKSRRPPQKYISGTLSSGATSERDEDAHQNHHRGLRATVDLSFRNFCPFCAARRTRFVRGKGVKSWIRNEKPKHQRGRNTDTPSGCHKRHFVHPIATSPPQKKNAPTVGLQTLHMCSYLGFTFRSCANTMFFSGVATWSVDCSWTLPHFGKTQREKQLQISNAGFIENLISDPQLFRWGY